MKRMAFILLFALMICCQFLHATPISLDLSAPSAVLINASNGSVLFDKDAYKTAYPASITKVATALYVFHLNLDLEELITAKQEAIASISPQAKKQSNYRSPAYWLETDGTHMGIKRGEMISLKDLLYGMMIVSANDAANVIAQHISGTIPQFMEDLNKFLTKIGCENTHFCNPHGLHHPEHVSTPYDMALITKEAMKYPEFNKIVSTVRYTTAETNLQGPRNLIQTNHLIRNGKHYYSKAIGVKTGYHSIAGKTLIAAAKDQGRTLIAVVFGCKNVAERYKDVTRLFESVFNQPKLQKKMLTQGIQKIFCKINEAKKPIQTYLKEDFIWEYFPYEEEQVKLIVAWENVDLPVLKDQVVGYVQLIDSKGKLLKQAKLYANENAQASLLFNLKKKGYIPIIISCICGVISLFFLFRKKKRKGFIG